jgi:hypothetical protein
MTKFFDFAGRQIYPHVVVFVHERFMRKKLEETKDRLFVAQSDDTPEIVIQELRADYERELERRYRIIDKGKGAFLIIGVTVGIMTGTISYVLDHSEIGTLHRILVGVAILSLVLCSIALTAALTLRERYGIFLDSMITENNSILSIVSMSRKQLVEYLYHAGKLNQIGTTIIANYVDASYVGIRNSLILLALVCGLALSPSGTLPHKPGVFRQSSRPSPKVMHAGADGQAIGLPDGGNHAEDAGIGTSTSSP